MAGNASVGNTPQMRIDPKVVRKWVYLIIGLLILTASCLMPALGDLKPQGVKTLGVMVTTVFFWVTETLPIPVTGLLVLIMLHITGAMTFNKVIAQSFGDPFVPFVIGCLALAVAFQQSGLGKRITYLMLSVSGTKATRILHTYFWISFVISAFITDVAVTAMMLPIALSLAKSIGSQPGKSNFGICLMFAITFGAIFGGLCTPSGVPSNIITISFLEKNAHLTVTFLEWTMIATPIAIVLGIFSQWLTLRLFPPEIQSLPYGQDVIKKDLKDMGDWTREEKTTFVVFMVAVLLWLSGNWNKLPVPLVALVIVVLLTLPGISAFKGWREIESKLEWGALMLMVGGFSLGVAAYENGLASWAAKYALKPLSTLPLYMQPFAITLLVAIDSLGFSSFTAASSVNVPLTIAYAQQNGFPCLSMAMTAGLASSTHFILVTESLCCVLTYASGYYTFKDMFKIGTILTIASAIVIALGLTIAGLPAGTPIK